MRSRSVSMLAVTFALTGLLTAAPFFSVAEAQDTAAQGTNCDSTLMLLVLLSQQGFGYQSALDINTFNRGQFQTYFDEAAAGGTTGGDAAAGGTTGGDAGATGGDTTGQDSAAGGTTGGDAGATGGDTTGQDSAAGGTTGGDAGAMTSLMAGAVAGEDPRCAELRTDVETFVTTQLQGGMRLGMAGMGAQGATGTGG